MLIAPLAPELVVPEEKLKAPLMPPSPASKLLIEIEPDDFAAPTPDSTEVKPPVALDDKPDWNNTSPPVADPWPAWKFAAPPTPDAWLD